MRVGSNEEFPRLFLLNDYLQLIVQVCCLRLFWQVSEGTKGLLSVPFKAQGGDHQALNPGHGWEENWPFETQGPVSVNSVLS